jgi:hypothetical protein
MNRHSAQKQGKQSGAQKMASTRHPFEPAPSTSPTLGAFGKEAEPVRPDSQTRTIARETEQPVGGRRKGRRKAQ